MGHNLYRFAGAIVLGSVLGITTRGLTEYGLRALNSHLRSPSFFVHVHDAAERREIGIEHGNITSPASIEEVTIYSSPPRHLRGEWVDLGVVATYRDDSVVPDHQKQIWQLAGLRAKEEALERAVQAAIDAGARGVAFRVVDHEVDGRHHLIGKAWVGYIK